MAFGIKANNVKSILSYNAAVQHFEQTPVPHTRSAKIWGEYCRPLYNTRSEHFALTRGTYVDLAGDEREYFDCRLYGTSLVRYFKPDFDGSYAVWLRGHASNSSWAFLFRMGWLWRKLVRTDNNESVLLLVSSEVGAAKKLFNDNFTTRLVLHPDQTLDTARSVSIPLFTKVSTTELRDKCAQARKTMDVVLNMVDMQYTSILSGIAVNWYQMRPFAGPRRLFDYNSMMRIRHNVTALLNGDATSDTLPACMASAIEYAQEYAKAAAQRMMNQKLSEWPKLSEWHNYATLKYNMKYNELNMHELPEEVQAAVAPSQESIRKSVERELLDIANLHRPDGRKALPMFPVSAPAKMCWGNEHGDLWEEYGQHLYDTLAARYRMVY